MRDIYALEFDVEEVGEWSTVTISSSVPCGPLDDPEEFGSPSDEELGAAIQTTWGFLARLVLLIQGIKGAEVTHNLNEFDSEEVFQVRAEIPSTELVDDSPGDWLGQLVGDDDRAMRAAEVRETRRQVVARMWQNTADQARRHVAEHPDAAELPTDVDLDPVGLERNGQPEAAAEVRAYLDAVTQRREFGARAERERIERERAAREEAYQAYKLGHPPEPADLPEQEPDRPSVAAELESRENDPFRPRAVNPFGSPPEPTG